MNSRQLRHETRNDLQDSPRRRHPRNTENASHALSPPECKASARSVFLGNKVCIINFFCATEVSSYRLFRPPCSSSESHTITKPSFNANGHWHQSSNYLPMETGATTSKQEICGSATSAATGPSSTSSLAGEPKYLSFCPLTAQALNVTILFD